ncbi:MAG: PAS-domain containing protein [Pelagibaca sp.]
MDSLVLAATLLGLTCVAGGVLLIRFLRKSAQPDTHHQEAQTVTMLFQDGTLIDANDQIWSLVPELPSTPTWDDIRTLLLPIASDLPETLCPTQISADMSRMGLTISKEATTFRVTLSPPISAGEDWFTEKHSGAFASQMQSAVMRAPDVMWCITRKGELIWGNDTFMLYANAYGGAHSFADHMAKHASPEAQRSKRVKLTSDDLKPHLSRWLELTVEETDTGLIHFARGIDAVMRAEAAQQNFVQTLSKTFANLTTGLAIFDRDRRLVLFNPALVDLSRVPIDFLSSRPAMFEFFDKLRDYRIMPEPKNYDDWRERMAKLVAAACDDRFRETWTLASGQTFDITGQPYPDGAIAFLFNDITAEVSLTRGFRAELDTLQSVIDTMEDAVAVFDPQGTLTVCNTAYADLWSVDPDACIPETTIIEATQSWKSAFHPSPVWPELRDFVTSTTERVSWDSELRSKDGREVVCRVDPICHGATLIRFCFRPRQRDAQPESEGLQIVSA